MFCHELTGGPINMACKVLSISKGKNENGHEPLVLASTGKQWKPSNRRTWGVWMRKLKSNRNREVKRRRNYFCEHLKNRKGRAKTFAQKFFLAWGITSLDSPSPLWILVGQANIPKSHLLSCPLSSLALMVLVLPNKGGSQVCSPGRRRKKEDQTHKSERDT